MEAHPLPLLPSEIRLRNLFHQSAGPSFLANFRCVRNSIRRNKSSPECNSFDKMWQPLEWMKPAQPATFAATLNFGSKIFKSGDEKTFRETSSAAMIYWRNLWNQRLVPWPGGWTVPKSMKWSNISVDRRAKDFPMERPPLFQRAEPKDVCDEDQQTMKHQPVSQFSRWAISNINVLTMVSSRCSLKRLFQNVPEWQRVVKC